MKAIQHTHNARPACYNAHPTRYNAKKRVKPCTKPCTRARAVVKNVIKYALLTVAAVALFERARIYALADRGYEAIGGEYLVLALPLLWYGIESTFRDTVRNIRKGGDPE